MNIDRSHFFEQLLKRVNCFSAVSALIILFSFCSPVFVSAEGLFCGIDMLESSGFRELSGLRVGLITNVAGVNRRGEPDYALMLKNGVRLKYIMAPEHGFSADIEAGKKVGGTCIHDSLPVLSLYGASKKPDIRDLNRIDILVFDLQDVGARCYTYISTMNLAMQACEEAGIAFMVLDRPNPVIPLSPQGFMLAPQYESFVGAVDIPFIHSMTVGEIAMLLKDRKYKRLDLRVIALSGYSRNKFADEYPDFRFISPSPNIRSVDTAILYPATVFLEATIVSEGRGTDAPFMQFGAPFISGREVADALKEYHLPGVQFDAVSFQPVSGKFKGEHCQGVKLALTDRKTFSPFKTAATILLVLQRLYPDKTGLDKKNDFFDKLAGTSLFREMLIKQKPLDVIMHESHNEIEQFNRTTPIKLLYQ